MISDYVTNMFMVLTALLSEWLKLSLLNEKSFMQLPRNVMRSTNIVRPVTTIITVAIISKAKFVKKL